MRCLPARLPVAQHCPPTLYTPQHALHPNSALDHLRVKRYHQLHGMKRALQIAMLTCHMHRCCSVRGLFAAMNAIASISHGKEGFPNLKEAWCSQVVGHLRADVARDLGLTEEVAVAPGSGDNQMSALGAGAVKEGAWVVSLGTSGGSL